MRVGGAGFAFVFDIVISSFAIVSLWKRELVVLLRSAATSFGVNLYVLLQCSNR